jgi:hypothetical protein
VTTIAIALFDGAEELDFYSFASGNPPSGFPPLDPRLRRGKSLKASPTGPQELLGRGR